MMKITKIPTGGGRYESPTCTVDEVLTEGFLCMSPGAATENLGNDYNYTWGTTE